MKTSSIIHRLPALRGLRSLVLGTLAGVLLGTAAQAFPINLLSNSDFSVGEDGLTGWSTTRTPSDLTSGTFAVSDPGQVYGYFQGEGSYSVDFNHAITLGPVLKSAVLAFSWYESPGYYYGYNINTPGLPSAPRTFSVQVVDSTNTVVSTLYSTNVNSYLPTLSGPHANNQLPNGNVYLDVTEALNSLPAGTYTFRFDSFIPTSYYENDAQIVISNVSLLGEAGNSIVCEKGDAVPGVKGAKFTGFGTPAINASGTIAMFGKWTGAARGAGIFVGDSLVVKVGDEIPAGSGVKVRWLLDPVIDDAGHVAIPALLMGPGINSNNDDVILSNASGTLAVVAQQGTQAADAPEGAQWKTFSSVAASGNGGVIVLAYLAQGPGGISAANDNGLWASGADGVFHLLLQEGKTSIGGKTVKTIAVLKSVPGTPGQTHGFNSSGELVSKVTFSDNSQAVVHTPLP